MSGQIKSAHDARAYILGGGSETHCVNVTLVGRETRYTYRVAPCRERAGLWFVSVMYGADNESAYVYIGTLRTVAGGDIKYTHGTKSKLVATDKRSLAFAWVWDNIERGNRLPPGAEIWHDGRCCRCGRLLTVPGNVERGIGPECATKSFMAFAA